MLEKRNAAVNTNTFHPAWAIREIYWFGQPAYHEAFSRYKVVREVSMTHFSAVGGLVAISHRSKIEHPLLRCPNPFFDSLS